MCWFALVGLVCNGRRSSRAGEKMENKRCHKCGKTGHIATKCSSGKTKNIKCHLCGKGGHIRSECPGIEDDGEGQSKFKGKSAPQKGVKKSHHKRERFDHITMITLIFFIY